MKKILALVLALVMVLGCVPAMAADIPAHVDDISDAPEKPTAPKFTLEQKDFGYTLTFADGKPDGINEQEVLLRGFHEDGYGDGVYLDWNEENKRFESSYSLMPECQNDMQLDLRFDGYSVSVDAVTGKTLSASLFKDSDGVREDWDWSSDGEINYWVTGENGIELDVYFDAETGELTKYGIWGEDWSLTEYSPDGKVLYADMRYEDDWIYWDAETQQWINDDGEPVEGVPAPEERDPLVPKKKKPVWYGNNTMGVAGLSLRDMGKTDKWYNVVPVDLSKDGSYSFPLVASNLFYIGQVNVTVKDGVVTTTYETQDGHIYMKGENLNWFTSLDQIGKDYLSNPTGGFAFGEGVNVAEKLGGAKIGLLFICNRVTYRQPFNGDGDMLVRYWPNSHYLDDYQDALQQMLDAMAEANAPATPTDTATATDAK